MRTTASRCDRVPVVPLSSLRRANAAPVETIEPPHASASSMLVAPLRGLTDEPRLAVEGQH